MAAVGSGAHIRDESELVYRWRLEKLLLAGYDRRAARQLASDFAIDLHVAMELAQRGCPMKIAMRILL